MSLAQSNPVTFIHTRDRERAKSFYANMLGLALGHEDPHAVVFDLNGIPLRITTIPDHHPLPHTILGWAVADIVAMVGQLRQKGVTFQIYEGFGQDELGIWNSPDGKAKVAWFNDPDGNNLSLTQF